jgi:hypothetical protein
MRIRSGTRKNERGATLALVAVCLTALTGVGAIAVDLGMLLKARSDAQRAAEAAALAGASAFVDFAANDPAAVDTANARADRYAKLNTILNKPVADADIQAVQVITDSQKVRVVVGRAGVGTWFARILGVGSVPINARAAALVSEGAGTNCVKPIMIPDLWGEGPGPTSQDANGNRLPDDTPTWSFDPGQGDSYAPLSQTGFGSQTGYGSDFRNGFADATGAAYQQDYGRELVLNPKSSGTEMGPNEFDMWTFPDDNAGSSGLVDRIENCDPREVSVGEPFPVAPGTRPPVAGPIQDLINLDPGARWDNGTVAGSQAGDWRASPRVIKVAIFDPNQISQIQGRGEVTFNNFALLFLENVDGSNTITGRFLYYVPGSGAGQGSLIKALRLVE